MSKKEEAAANGQTSTFISPSGLEIVIREQNGDDEGLINVKNIIKGDSIHFFLSGIIMRVNGEKISTKDVIAMKNRDKYHSLLKSRIFSLGPDLTYKHRCSNTNCTKPQGVDDPIYEEDLSSYDQDFSNPEAEAKREPFKYRVEAYLQKEGKMREFTISSGKQLRYKFYTGEEEKKLVEMPNEKISKNTEILLRGLECKMDNDIWQVIENFKMFNSKEMMEIRKDIKDNDMPFEAISECTCPYCGNIDHISLLAQGGFFFPGEI